MSVIQALIKYMESCPLLAENSKVFVDLTPVEAGSLGVSASSSNLLKKYLDKSCLWESNYILFIRAATGEDKQRLNHNQFLEDLGYWFCEQNRKRSFPLLEEKLKPLAIESINPMVHSLEPDGTGVYQVQIKLTYYAMT